MQSPADDPFGDPLTRLPFFPHHDSAPSLSHQVYFGVLAVSVVVRAHYFSATVQVRTPDLLSDLKNSVSLPLVNPRPEGYGSRFVVLSIYLSVNSATEGSAYFFAPVKVRTG